VRLDGAFYDRKIVESLDAKRLGYAIVARMYQPLKNRMVQARYHDFSRGWQGADFTYTPFNWKAEHRYVVVRRPVALEPEEIQKRLFSFKHYTYHRALVTNLELTPEAVWRLYCDRAFQELLLREFKGAYAMAKIPTRSFWANATYLDDPVGLRPGLGIPVSVFAQRSAALEHFHIASRALVVARRMGQKRQPQPLDAAGQVSSSGPLSENPTGHRKNHTDYLNGFATVLTALPSQK
jgi:hypothetical protein